MARAVLPRSSAHERWLLLGLDDNAPSSEQRRPPLEEETEDEPTRSTVQVGPETQDDPREEADDQDAAADE
jgi:hypothetical protein